MPLCLFIAENMPRALAVIDAAILEWQAATCIRFIQRTTEKDYLVFLRDNRYSLFSKSNSCNFIDPRAQMITFSGIHFTFGYSLCLQALRLKNSDENDSSIR